MPEAIPNQVGDFFVATNAPRNDMEKGETYDALGWALFNKIK